MIDAGITEEMLEQVAESSISTDGTLVLDLPIDVTKVKRILLTQTGSDIGNMYYVD